MAENIAHIFPAFVLKYTGKEISILEKYSHNISKRIKLASEILDIDLTGFDIASNNFLKDEQKNQFMSYIFSCAFSDISKDILAVPAYVSGFSMGIYSAYYHTRTIDFTTGLLLIDEIYKTARKILNEELYTMASVVGFTIADIQKYLENFEDIEVVIQNGSYSFVIAGKRSRISSIMDFLRNEGAIYLNLFEVACPYHSNILNKKEDLFSDIVQKYSFAQPTYPLLSMIDQKLIKTSNEAKEEIIKNVIYPLNFYKTILHFLDNEVNSFIEVGPGDSLLKSSKFIEGAFSFKAVSKGKIL